MVKRWPFQTEESLKLIVRNANSSGKTEKNALLYQKLKYLLPMKQKEISTKDRQFNTDIAMLYNNIINLKHASKPKQSSYVDDTLTLCNMPSLYPCEERTSISTLPQTHQGFTPPKKCTSTPVKKSKSNWTLEEQKRLIKLIFEMKPEFSACNITEHVAKEMFPAIQTRVNRPLSSITSHWFCILQPVILSHMYGKLEYPIISAIFSHLISQKVNTIVDIDWKNLLRIWPFQTEKSLKAIVNRANDDARLPPDKVILYEKLHTLLPYYVNKKISPKKMKSNQELVNFYEGVMIQKRQNSYKKL